MIQETTLIRTTFDLARLTLLVQHTCASNVANHAANSSSRVRQVMSQRTNDTVLDKWCQTRYSILSSLSLVSDCYYDNNNNKYYYQQQQQYDQQQYPGREATQACGRDASSFCFSNSSAKRSRSASSSGGQRLLLLLIIIILLMINMIIIRRHKQNHHIARKKSAPQNSSWNFSGISHYYIYIYISLYIYIYTHIVYYQQYIHI